MRNSQSLPIGVIGENNLFAYGFDGKKYWVSEGILGYYVAKIHLSFEESKQLFDALTFEAPSEICTKNISNLVRISRKKKLFGKNLFFFFVKNIR